METKVIQLPIMSVVNVSADKFRGIPEPGQSINRPLMVNAWSQTTGSDFSYLHEIENREKQSQRERELEEKVRVLEENLKAHTELLSQIHATSARTSVLLSQQQPPSQQYNNNIGYSSANISSNSTRAAQISPKIVNTLNPTQLVNCSPAESVKYKILAEGTSNNNGEPIDIQLAEDVGAFNLNSSPDSGLEICMDAEDNNEIKSEDNIANNSTTIDHQAAPAPAPPTPTPTDTTPSEHHFTTPSEHNSIKRKKLAALLAVAEYELNNQSITTNSTIQQQLTTQKRRSSGNSLLNGQKIKIIRLQSKPIQNDKPSPTDNSTPGSDMSNINYDPENVMVSIGPNNTRIPAKLYNSMNWTSASMATRKLLMAIFDRKVLATHSMTGKPSPAFKDQCKPVKEMLDPLVIADIIFAVTRKCQVSDKEVRNAITTKCADENKMMKLQMNKRAPLREINKENRTG